MAKFTSKFPELAFYVKDELCKFHNGEYSTQDKAEIEVLEKLADVVREAGDTPKPKAPAKKSSGK
ncbi:hypothetical protein [Neobacillus mesonae]|uniref:Uncharacterized protein n=1 Tax=Neobacillus mesonae TaxID=1193713 RepID=A0A3T0HVS5_9BACI|nr:hypothetical protein [Neobacillus mesonae]AZU61068.1 hypothetical protein CHR53_07270 [Neobacillus mesonae]